MVIPGEDHALIFIVSEASLNGLEIYQLREWVNGNEKVSAGDLVAWLE